MIRKKSRSYNLLQASNDIASAICEKMVEVVGMDAALGVLVPVATQISKEYTDMMIKVVGVKGKNAMTCQFLNRLIVNTILGTKMIEQTFGADYAEDRVQFCPYLDVATRYKGKFVCEVCKAFEDGIAASVNKNIRVKKVGRLSDGDAYCGVIYEVDNPPDSIDPYTIRTNMMQYFISFYAKIAFHRRAVKYAAGVLAEFGKKLRQIVGPNACLIPARGTESAGEYISRALKEGLKLGSSKEDAAAVIEETHNLFGRAPRIKLNSSSLEVTSKKCDFVEVCTKDEGRFIETACLHLFNGIASNFNMEVDLEKSKKKDGCYGCRECRMVFNRKR
jgi:predicted ArsR family transcriptional regulator